MIFFGIFFGSMVRRRRGVTRYNGLVGPVQGEARAAPSNKSSATQTKMIGVGFPKGDDQRQEGATLFRDFEHRSNSTEIHYEQTKVGVDGEKMERCTQVHGDRFDLRYATRQMSFEWRHLPVCGS